jgi:thiol:disulfide interchange protein DsbD
MTFSTPEVQKAFDDFSIFQIDLTGTAGKVADKARRRFDVQGVPTIIIIDDNGNETDRITGFINSREMIQKLSRFK